ncbi:hypothetical protein U14_02757 [Candidatus Moduliflexus flocculans]|uniref:Uncharacterized protein n=1 Tax=Candidatus Moduliflexus flocculans TaxID=1499966 RepID=A0A081BM96_9BACT|nr:hypothetical protein U14_02757 [Candidatus Moduliflexus flocculans]
MFFSKSSTFINIFILELKNRSYTYMCKKNRHHTRKILAIKECIIAKIKGFCENYLCKKIRHSPK